MQIFHRTKAFSQLDLDQLTQETWWCLAAGCAECQALELFGLCYLELSCGELVNFFVSPTDFFCFGVLGDFLLLNKAGGMLVHAIFGSHLWS